MVGLRFFVICVESIVFCTVGFRGYDLPMKGDCYE